MRRRMLLTHAGLYGVLLFTSACKSARATATQERDYPIMSWEIAPRSDAFAGSRNGMNSLVECGYTRIGLVKPSQLPLCDKLHVEAIVCPEQELTKNQWATMSDQQIDDTIRTLVEQSKHSRSVVGYFITDEPHTREFAALAKAVAAVRKYAPGKIAYINLYPDYARVSSTGPSQLGAESYTAYLERFVNEIKPDLISYDNYRIEYANDLKTPKTAESYFTNLVIVRRVAQEHNLPFWNVTCANQIRPYTTIPSPANLQLEAYTTLATGAQCLAWYTYYQGRYFYMAVNDQGNRTPTWSYLKMVNDQVQVIGKVTQKLKSTGVYFTRPAPAEGLPTLPGELTEDVQSETQIMIGEFSGSASEKYVLLVNLSLAQSSKVLLKPTQSHHAIGYISPVDGSLLPLDKDGSLWLTAGQGALIKLE